MQYLEHVCSGIELSYAAYAFNNLNIIIDVVTDLVNQSVNRLRHCTVNWSLLLFTKYNY